MNSNVGLYDAVVNYRTRHVKYLLAQGLPINQKNDRGEGVLHAALNIDHAARRRKMFHFLLYRGADYLTEDHLREMDILQWACYLGRTEQVRQLVQFAAGDLDYQRRDLQGRTALHLATLLGDPEIVEIICGEMRRLYISVDIPDMERLTPYLLAQRLGFAEVADILEKTGGASRCQFDTIKFRNSTEWSETGREERRQREKKRTFTFQMLHGRPPQLRVNHRSNCQNALHSITKGKPHRLEPITHTQVHGPALAKKELPVSEDAQHSSTDVTTSREEGVGRHTQVAATSGTTTTEPSGMDDILTILGEQLSNSFRKPVPPPPPKEPTLFTLKRVSTLAVIMSRLRTKPRNSKLQNAVLAVVKGKGKGGNKRHSLVNTVQLMNKNKRNSLVNTVHLINKSKVLKQRETPTSQQDCHSGSPVPYPTTSNAIS